MKEQAEESEYTTEYFENDIYAGFEARKHINDLTKDFSLTEAFGDEYVKDKENSGIVTKKSFFKTEISQNVDIDLTSMEDVASVVELNYKVKLPMKAKTNNASVVEDGGRTLTWNLKGGEINKVEFKAVGLNYTILIGIAVLVVLVIAGVVFFVTKFLKNKKVTE